MSDTTKSCTAKPALTAIVTATNGIRFQARILRKGDGYGADGQGPLVWEDERAGVEFFDMRYPFTEFGQFTGGRYYVETVLANHENGDHESAWGGLVLDGGVPDWKIDAAAMFVVRQWLHHETGEIG